MTSMENWKYLSMAIQSVCAMHEQADAGEWDKNVSMESFGYLYGPRQLLINNHWKHHRYSYKNMHNIIMSSSLYNKILSFDVSLYVSLTSLCKSTILHFYHLLYINKKKDLRIKCVISVSSVCQSCATLCNPMDWNISGFPVHHHLPELAQTHIHPFGDAIQTFHPLLSPSLPAFNLS